MIKHSCGLPLPLPRPEKGDWNEALVSSLNGREDQERKSIPSWPGSQCKAKTERKMSSM